MLKNFFSLLLFITFVSVSCAQPVLADFQSYDDALQAAYDDSQAQHFSEAEANFKFAVSLANTNEDKAAAYIGLGQVYEDTNRFTEATKSYDSALALDGVSTPRKMLALQGKAKLHIKRKQYRMARQDLDKALRLPNLLAPAKVILQSEIGATFSKEKKFAQARAEYTKLLRYKNEWPVVEASTYFYIGQTYLNEAKNLQARQQFLKAIGANPQTITSQIPSEARGTIVGLIVTVQQQAQLGIANSFFAEKNYLQAKIEYSKTLAMEKLNPNVKAQAANQLKVIANLETKAGGATTQ